MLHDPIRTTSGVRNLVMNVARVTLAALAVLLAACRDTTAPVATAPHTAGVNALVVAGATYTQVSAGTYSSCATTRDGKVACWGNFVPWPALTGVTLTRAFYGGGACAITSGAVQCWGNSFGDPAAPIDDAADVVAGYAHACALRFTGQVACWGDNTSNQYPASGAWSNVVQLSAAGYGTCARFQSGTISCVGSDRGSGQFAVPASLIAVQFSTNYESNTCAVRTDSTVVCWGLSSNINAVPADLINVVEVSTGADFACARLGSGAVRCWGSGNSLQTTPPAGLVATYISVGNQHACALQGYGAIEGKGEIVCWGGNLFGESSPPTSQRILPTAMFQFPSSVAAGTGFTLSLTGAQVVGGPAGIAFSYAFDCGNGAGFGAASASSSVTCPTTVGGTRTVQGKVIDLDNDFSTYSGTVSVLQSAQTIVVTSTPPIPAYVGGTYSPSATGGVSGNPVTFSSSTPATCGATGGTISFLAVGACTVAANQAAGAGYPAATQVTQTFSISQQPQSITFAALPASQPVGTALTLSATGGASGNPVVFTTTTPGTCTISGSSLTLIASGACTVAASQSGNATYAAAPEVTRSTAAVRLAQIITMTSSIPASAPTGTVVTLSATGGASGNPVLFASQTTAVCGVSGNSLTLSAAGTCTFVATQAGNATYDAATPVTRSITATATQGGTTLARLRAAVTSSTIEVPLRTSLSVTLYGAQVSIDNHARRAACGLLDAFEIQVKAQRNRRIPVALADSWLAQVAQVERENGC